jgi:hypothetical protein
LERRADRLIGDEAAASRLSKPRSTTAIAAATAGKRRFIGNGDPCGERRVARDFVPAAHAAQAE